jgi:adenine-specific DNA-methyltransferase
MPCFTVLSNGKQWPNTTSAPWIRIVKRDPDLTFFTDLEEAKILDRMRSKHPKMRSLLSGSIQRGVSPDLAKAHSMSRAEAQALHLETALLRPSVSGQQIKRYHLWECDEVIVYTDNNTRIQDYPNTVRWLATHRQFNKCKEVSSEKHPWWRLHRPRDPAIFRSPKFIGLTTIKTIELIYDSTRHAYVTDAMYIFAVRADVDPWAFMAIAQSKPFLFLYRVSNQGESRVIPQIKASKLQPLPFPLANAPADSIEHLSTLCKRMLEINAGAQNCRNPQEMQKFRRNISSIDEEIDSCTYRLYGLTSKEAGVIERSLLDEMPIPGSTQD